MPMRKWLLIAAIVLAVILLVMGATTYYTYRATQYVPEFYRQATASPDPVKQKAGSEQMLRRATALASDVKKEGAWKALFTEEQINGWLAVDLVKNHAGSLPPTIREPRVSIEPGQLTVACRYQHGRWQTVLWLTVEASVAGQDAIALRIRKARAGSLPLPLDEVLKQISEAARRAQQPIEWRQVEGDPVALIPLKPPQGGPGTVQIDTLVLRQGEIYMAGTTKRR